MRDGNKVRIGFVGVGGMGQCAHLCNYATLPDCEVAAVAEIRPELGKLVAARYGIPKVYPDHQAMLAAESLDGIVALQPFTRHGVLMPELLEAHRPLFIEKPLSGCIACGEQILQSLDASGTWVMVGYHKRSDPATMWAKAEIDRLRTSRELGVLRYVRILMPAGDWIAGGFNDLIDTGEPVPSLEHELPAEDMDAETNAEYITFVNYYIHQVNLMRYLLGEDYRVAYAAPSGVLLAMESASGISGTIEMSPYHTTVDWEEEALIAFERGYLRLRLPAPLTRNRAGQVELFRDPGGSATPERVIPSLPWVHAMRQQAMNFLAAIRGERRPPCEAAEALEDLKTARDYIRLRFGK